MSWLFVFLILIMLSQVVISEVHPIRLAGVVLFMSLLSVVSMNFFVGPLYAVCSFMVLVGGVLVVFGYAVSLVPFESDVKKDSNEMILKELVKLVGLMGFLSVMIAGIKNYYFSFFFVSDCLYYSGSWGLMVVMLGFYLLFGMITSVRICSCYKGALVR